MRRLFSFNMMTLDGFFEGPNRDISWHRVDSEFNDYAISQLHEIDTLLFGRLTYELMATYWPAPDALRDDAAVAGLMNRMPKVVFSRTLQQAGWENTRLVRDHVGEEVLALKQQPGKSIAVLGSADLLSTLIHLHLVDEHRVMLNPVILGSGTPLFKKSDASVAMQLLSASTFGNGNVLLRYEPDGK